MSISTQSKTKRRKQRNQRKQHQQRTRQQQHPDLGHWTLDCDGQPMVSFGPTLGLDHDEQRTIVNITSMLVFAARHSDPSVANGLIDDILSGSMGLNIDKRLLMVGLLQGLQDGSLAPGQVAAQLSNATVTVHSDLLTLIG